eukprot:2636149-Rhodomonas_salina.2
MSGTYVSYGATRCTWATTRYYYASPDHHSPFPCPGNDQYSAYYSAIIGLWCCVSLGTDMGFGAR